MVRYNLDSDECVMVEILYFSRDFLIWDGVGRGNYGERWGYFVSYRLSSSLCREMGDNRRFLKVNYLRE